MSKVNVTIQMDSDLKEQADELFSELGLNMNIAVNMFIRQTLRLGKIPFELAVDRPNQETIEAMLEAQRILLDPTVKKYDDVDEFLADLKSECKE